MSLPAVLPKDAYKVGTRASGEVHGVVLTKPHIVELILDLAGYTPDNDLASMRLLDPACGHGAFLTPAVHRLIAVAKRQQVPISSLSDAIRAYDIDPEHIAITRRAVGNALRDSVADTVAQKLAESWVVQGDFLLTPATTAYDAVVGNPPYVRIEQFAASLQQEYRRRFTSIYDRADLYVAFIEHGLNLLGAGGVLSFICPDRWTLNKYGAPLRRLVTERFHIRSYIDLHQASPFESDVIAYPAIFAIGRRKVERVGVAALTDASADECSQVIDSLSAKSGVSVTHYTSWFKGEEPWVLGTPEQLKALRDLECRHQPIETGDTKVRIGVATGNDKVYIVDGSADIEGDRLVPLVMRADISKGQVADAGRFVINTFADTGGVVDLNRYPRLARYLETHREVVRARHVAKNNERTWFRTIDRVYPDLVSVPKLLIPDIAGSNEVVLEPGRFHPHHNLYFVTSGSWDMRVLGALLSSKVALFFVWSYAVKMRGRYLRFQAQYLRRIRLPSPSQIDSDLAAQLARAFDQRDFRTIDALALKAYGIEGLPTFDFVDTRK